MTPALAILGAVRRVSDRDFVFSGCGGRTGHPTSIPPRRPSNSASFTGRFSDYVDATDGREHGRPHTRATRDLVSRPALRETTCCVRVPPTRIELVHAV